ncbi:MAG: class II aldolase/adducin family protein [Bacteroidota bacterium]|nr:class II aldolase/adducin family protein [Bacteroidota bacterium]
MKLDLMFEPDQIVEITRKFVERGFRLCNGGSVSICDPDGNIYISTQKFDTINPETRRVIYIDKDDKKYYDIKKASEELPIHRAIYTKRGDINAVCHVFSPAIAAIGSTTNQNVFNLFPRLNKKAGITHFSEYVKNFNTEQVNAFVSRFANGASNIIVDGTGVYTTGRTVFEAFHKAEMLDHFAKMYLNANSLGDLMYPAEKNIEQFNKIEIDFPQYLRGRRNNKEMDSLKIGLIRLALYTYNKNQTTSLLGSMSIRINKESYMTVPGNVDKSKLKPEDLVIMKHEKSEAWKLPNDDLKIHEMILNNNVKISCVAITFPTSCSVYTLTDKQLELENVKVAKLPFETIFDLDQIDKSIKEGNEVMVIENDLIIIVARNMYRMNVIMENLNMTCDEKKS